jgi:hypothetical protein
MRPAVFQVGGVLYWVLQTRNPDTMVLTDADSTPSVAVRKNGASVADSVTITKRSATTGIYDCSYNPAAEVEGDSFTLEESAAVTGTTTSSATYTQTWNARVVAVERGTDGVTALLPAALESGRIAAALGSATQTQIDNIEATLTTLGSESTTVERSVSDTNAITFSWPVSGATITGTASLNNGAYGAVTGAIAFLRTETGRHYYTLAYNAADRTSAEGQVRYKFVDGTYTGYVVLRTVTTVLADAAHGGAAATLVLSTIDIQPASADTPGVLIRGTGYAAGIDVKGGEYADGIKARSGDTSGYGICSNGVQGGARFWSTNGYGVRVSSDNSNAFSIYGGTYAFQINSVNNAIDVYSSTGNAVYLQSAQNDAVVIYPGADDIGVHIWGGQTSGDAVALSSNGTGSVFYPVDLSGLNDLSAADVNAEVVDVLSVDTFAELSAPPAATSSLKDKITWLFMYARNKVTQTSSQRKLYRDDTTTVAGTSGTSDNGTTFTKGEDS